MFVFRSGTTYALKIAPQYRADEQSVRAGFMLGAGAVRRAGPLAGSLLALQQIERSITYVTAGVAMLVSGRIGLDQMAGPIGIAKLAGDAGASGPVDFLLFLAFISVNLGLLNLLPIPALDGGRLLFLLAELFTRKPVNKGIENMVHTFGFVLLLTLLIYITLHNDLAMLLKR
jgi:regulator of sigma E protease